MKIRVCLIDAAVAEKEDTATLMHLSEQAGCNADGDCAGALEIVQACDAASVRKRKLSE